MTEPALKVAAVDNAATAATDATTNDNTAATNAAVTTRTILDDDAGDNTTTTNEPSWRDRLAGGDEKFRKQLDRFGAEADFGKAYREMEKLKANIKKPLPENPTPEQLAAYRKDNSIPETPDGYEKALKLPEGVIIGEADKPIVAEFLKTVHGKNWTQEAVNDALGWYYSTQDAQQIQLKEAERLARQETITDLQSEWGPEYKASHGMIKSWLERQPDKVGDMLGGARDDNGRALLNNSTFVKWLNNHIRETDPSATILHDAAASGISVKERIEAIQKVIGDDPHRYYKTEEGLRMQEELGRLLQAQSPQDEE